MTPLRLRSLPPSRPACATPALVQRGNTKPPPPSCALRPAKFARQVAGSAPCFRPLLPREVGSASRPVRAYRIPRAVAWSASPSFQSSPEGAIRSTLPAALLRHRRGPKTLLTKPRSLAAGGRRAVIRPPAVTSCSVSVRRDHPGRFERPLLGGPQDGDTVLVGGLDLLRRFGGGRTSLPVGVPSIPRYATGSAACPSSAAAASGGRAGSKAPDSAPAGSLSPAFRPTGRSAPIPRPRRTAGR